MLLPWRQSLGLMNAALMMLSLYCKDIGGRGLAEGAAIKVR